MKKAFSKYGEFRKVIKSTDHVCPSCGSQRISIFHKIESIPVHSVLKISTRENALDYPKADISLGFCQGCGFIFNLAFDPSMLEYSSDCEESQGCSPTFNAFSHRLANDLVKRYDLHQKDILEIGCGKGEFLTLLCELGDNRGVGFDPAYVDRSSFHGANKQITFIKDFYSENYSNYHADFICCKMTLEHIKDTFDFVSMVRRSIGDRTNTTVFFSGSRGYSHFA